MKLLHSLILRASRAIYAIGILAPILIIIALLALNNRHPKILILPLVQRVATVVDQGFPKKISCQVPQRDTIQQLTADKSWQPLTAPFELQPGVWYAAPYAAREGALLECDGLDIRANSVLAGAQGAKRIAPIFRIQSFQFGLPVFEVSQGLLMISKAATKMVGVAVPGGDQSYWTTPKELVVVRRPNEASGYATFISAQRMGSQDAQVFVVRKRGVHSGDSVTLRWSNPSRVTVYFSDRQAGFRPQRTTLDLD